MPKKTHFNTSFPLALTAQPASVPYRAHRALSPDKMPLHTSILQGTLGTPPPLSARDALSQGSRGGLRRAEKALPLPLGLPSPARPPPCTCLTSPRAGRPQLLSHMSRQLSRCSCLHGLPLPSLLFSRFLSSALPYGSS